MIIEMATTALISFSVARTPAISDTARYVSNQIEMSRGHLQNSVSLGLRGKGAFNELFTVAEECKVANWDGHEALPVAEDAYRSAFQFLEALPLGIEAPSVGAEPDGQLTLEWYRSPRRTISISISADGELHYAALIGLSKAYGTEPFFGEIPKSILDLIVKVINA